MAVEIDPKMYLPQIANMIGIGPIPKPKWMPKFWHRRLKRQQMEKAMSKWEPWQPEISKETVRMLIAQELRDFAEQIIGYSHVDPEKSAITRSTRRVGGTQWLQHFKYNPPKRKKVSERQHRRVLRRAVRETEKKLEAMGITT